MLDEEHLYPDLRLFLGHFGPLRDATGKRSSTSGGLVVSKLLPARHVVLGTSPVRRKAACNLNVCGEAPYPRCFGRKCLSLMHCLETMS